MQAILIVGTWNHNCFSSIVSFCRSNIVSDSKHMLLGLSDGLLYSISWKGEVKEICISHPEMRQFLFRELIVTFFLNKGFEQDFVFMYSSMGLLNLIHFHAMAVTLSHHYIL